MGSYRGGARFFPSTVKICFKRLSFDLLVSLLEVSIASEERSVGHGYTRIAIAISPFCFELASLLSELRPREGGRPLLETRCVGMLPDSW